MAIYSEKFKVDNILYEFAVASNYSISFAALRGSTSKGKFPLNNNWIDKSDEHGDLDISHSPLKTLVAVAELTKKWIRETRPYCFSFNGSTERKSRIYKKLIIRHFERELDIKKHYFFYQKDNDFMFYRKPLMT